LTPYRDAVKAFGRFRPTTGFCTLRAALDSDFKELFVTGFTFFKTPYGDGYRDALKDIQATKKHISDSDVHNPDIEYDEFKKLLVANAGKRITTDPTLNQILKNDGITIEVA
jgi:hypothetical protein